jgi:hypothetical protein
MVEGGPGVRGAEAGLARVHGGMHFRHSITAGEELGRRIAQRMAERRFARLA